MGTAYVSLGDSKKAKNVCIIFLVVVIVSGMHK